MFTRTLTGQVTTSLKLSGFKSKVANVQKQHVNYISRSQTFLCDIGQGGLHKTYQPSSVEDAWYERWEKKGLFAPKQKKEDGQRSWTMCLPPPNVTGTLHIGHALGCSIQDALIRWSRMNGYDTVWIPGTDHAGISTQVVVEKDLWKNKRLTRHDLGRDKFVEQVQAWKEQKGDVICEQMKQIGCSLDWKRLKFTLDPDMNKAVVEAFVRLHEEGLIYRDKMIVNWCCALQSNISDIEVEAVHIDKNTTFKIPGYQEAVVFGQMYSFAYPVHNSSEELVVCTTRPETMLGDVAVVINSADKRYQHVHGAQVIHPFTNQLLPVICDSHADMYKGTGVVKITPAHDFKDYEVAQRHSLNSMAIMDDSGHMINVPEKFMGSGRYKARELVLEDLKLKNLYRGVTQNHSMDVPLCSRTKDVVEPMLKSQWFLDCSEMAAKARKVVENGTLNIHPKHYTRMWYQQMDKTKEWCISRQLWWGHRIPAYRVYSKHTQGLVDGVGWVSGRSQDEALDKASQAANMNKQDLILQQDEDVLDTWFSSALFPFSSLGWPDKTEDLDRFYPTDMLVTASDILYFWVARMVMLGVHLTGMLPFHTVLFHRLVRDRYGRKMSKSLGNIIDPMDIVSGISLDAMLARLENTMTEVEDIVSMKQVYTTDYPEGIPQCGADSLRFTLCAYGFRGEDSIALDAEKRLKESRSLHLLGLSESTTASDIQKLVPHAESIDLFSRPKSDKCAALVVLPEGSDISVEREHLCDALRGASGGAYDGVMVDYVGEHSVTAAGWEGNSLNLDIADVVETTKFCNKIWQSFKYCTMKWEAGGFSPANDNTSLMEDFKFSATDRWILSRVSELVNTCHEAFSIPALSKVTDAIQTFWVDEFCSKYLEYSKLQLSSGNLDEIIATQQTLYVCVDVMLRCLAPFMPYLTEELYQRLPTDESSTASSTQTSRTSIHQQPYPKPQHCNWRNIELEEWMDKLQLITQKTHAIKNTLQIKDKVAITVYCKDEAGFHVVNEHKLMLEARAQASSINITQHTTDDHSQFYVVYEDDVLCVLVNVREHITAHHMSTFEQSIATTEAKIAEYTNAIAQGKRKNKYRKKLEAAQRHLERIEQSQLLAEKILDKPR